VETRTARPEGSRDEAQPIQTTTTCPAEMSPCICGSGPFGKGLPFSGGRGPEQKKSRRFFDALRGRSDNVSQENSSPGKGWTM